MSSDHPGSSTEQKLITKMRLVIWLSVVLLVPVVLCEECVTDDPRQDCGYITCAPGTHKACLRKVCTCSENNFPCATSTDCDQMGQHCARMSGWHCVSNICRCGGIWTDQN